MHCIFMCRKLPGGVTLEIDSCFIHCVLMCTTCLIIYIKTLGSIQSHCRHSPMLGELSGALDCFLGFHALYTVCGFHTHRRSGLCCFFIIFFLYMSVKERRFPPVSDSCLESMAIETSKMLHILCLPVGS